MKLSIIIPLYNQERLIKKCLRSCLNQGFNNNDFEIIVVNDCSTDGSLSVVRNFQRKYPKTVRIIDKKINEGVEKARFSGWSQAKGDYITNVDSDDWLEPMILQKAIKKIEEYNVDYVEFQHQRVIGNKLLQIKKPFISPVKGFITQPQLFNDYYISFFGKNILKVSLWGKVYRRNIIEMAKIEPEGICMGEDLVFNLKLFPNLHSIYIMDEIGYNYRWGGMTSKYNAHLWTNLKYLYYFKKNKVEEYNYQKARRYLDIEIKNVLRSEILQRIKWSKGDKKEIISFIDNELKSDIWQDNLLRANLSNYEEPYVRALMDNNSNEIYDLIYSEYQHNKFTKFLKRIFFYMVSNF